MEVTVFQIIALTLYAFLAILDGLGTDIGMSKPIQAGFFAGLIMGDVKLGLMVGATLQLMILGVGTPSISEEDKKTLSTALDYLEMMGYTKDIEYLGKDFNLYSDFYKTFGFYRYEENLYRQDNVYWSLNRQMPIMISGYDTLVVTDFYFGKDNPNSNGKLCTFEKSGQTYILSINYSLDSNDLWLLNSKNEELMRIPMQEVFDKFDTSSNSENYQISKDSINPEQATFTKENDKAIISLVALNVNIEKSNFDRPYNGEFYILIKIK